MTFWSSPRKSIWPDTHYLTPHILVSYLVIHWTVVTLCFETRVCSLSFSLCIVSGTGGSQFWIMLTSPHMCMFRIWRLRSWVYPQIPSCCTSLKVKPDSPPPWYLLHAQGTSGHLPTQPPEWTLALYISANLICWNFGFPRFNFMVWQCCKFRHIKHLVRVRKISCFIDFIYLLWLPQTQQERSQLWLKTTQKEQLHSWDSEKVTRWCSVKETKQKGKIWIYLRGHPVL